MKIELLTPRDGGWVLGEIGSRMYDCLYKKGFDVKINSKESSARAFDVSHRIGALGASASNARVKTGTICHIDTSLKFAQLVLLRQKYDFLFPISSEVCLKCRLAGWPKNKVSTTFLPALQTEARDLSQRVKIGYYSNIYNDGRKNEHWIKKLLFNNPSLKIDFEFVGTGWENFVNELKGVSNSSFRVISAFEKEAYLKSMRGVDYVLYTGFDDGAMSILDAINMNLNVIVSSTGWHKEAGIPSDNLFVNYKQFEKKILSISRDREMFTKFNSQMSWDFFVEKHVSCWNRMLDE